MDQKQTQRRLQKLSTCVQFLPKSLAARIGFAMCIGEGEQSGLGHELLQLIYTHCGKFLSSTC